MAHLWVAVTLISAFSLATSDAFTKKAVEDSNEYLVASFRLIFSLPLLFLLCFFVPVPELDRTFYVAFFLALPIELATVIMYVKALKLSPLSLTLPFLSLTPVFLILNAYLILGERVSTAGAVGIFLIAFGGYFLNIQELKKGLLQPFKAITKEKGSLLMIAVAFLYSITSSLGKMAIEHSSPLFFGITYFTALTFLFTPYGLWMGKGEVKAFMSGRKHRDMIIPGIFYAVMIVAHMTALNMTKVAYMISIKRTSLLIGVLYGYLFFKETNIRERFLGALVMFAGFVMVVSAR